MRQTKPKKKIIVKGNNLIEARYKLSLEEQRLILYLSSMIDPDDKEFTEYTISVDNFCQCTGIRKDNISNDFITIAKNLLTKTIVFKEGHETIVTAWLAQVIHNNKQNTITLSFAPKLKPYLLNLHSNFTKYVFENVIKLQSNYAIRMYELLKQYQNIGNRRLSIEAIKEMFCIEDKYTDYHDFKKRVILTAQKELKEQSDIYFEFEEIKKCKKVVELNFLIHTKSIKKIKQDKTSAITTHDQSIIDTPTDTPLLPFIKEPLTREDRESILNAANEDIERIKYWYKIALQQGNIKNLTAWLINQVKSGEKSEEVKHSVKVEKPVKQNPFINFTQRNIDYDKLEKLELEILKASMYDNHTE